MNIRAISVVALSNRDFPSFAAKLEEAERWIHYAARQESELVVLPELLNFYRGDGPGNPNALPFRETALSDWSRTISFFSNIARQCHLAIVVPLLISEGAALANVFFLIDKRGQVTGRFQKLRPTPEELAFGVVPGEPGILDWDGVPIAGAICFDTHFYSTFASQAHLGAKLMVIPSLWNGGPWLSGYSARLALPMAVSFPDWSRIIDLDGTTLIEGGYRQELLRYGDGTPVFTAALNFDREVFHFTGQAHKIREIQEQFGRSVGVRVLHEQSAFCVESRSPDLSVEDIIAEHDLVTYRDYLRTAEDAL